MRVEVAYALPTEQLLRTLELADGATVSSALAAVAREPLLIELDLAGMAVGIHGEPTSHNAPLHDGDRVEIYRPLLVDPMEARRRRARGG